MKKENLWLSYQNEDKEKLQAICERYKNCLDEGKTERECIDLTIRMAKEAGYRNLADIIAAKGKVSKGDKVYAVQMHKSIALFQIGEEPISTGMNILGAHIDSPRIDVKQNPLYEKEGFAYFDTHYYGGIKKYQWTTIPLSLHGRVARKDGTMVDICLGEKEEDPVFVITDLLIHLAGEQMGKKATEVVTGENLDLLIGNIPLEKDSDTSKEEKETIKANVLRLLADQYGIDEEDFQSAELEIVPAGKARDCGFDRSMVLSYGQDDRICAFTSLFAMLDAKCGTRTQCCLLVDKEEIGSVGATGMQSHFFENSVADVLDALGQYSDLRLRKALKNSSMLSSDVSAGYDPAFAEAFEKKNSAYLGRGIVLNKFTGARGKSGSNDANAEYVARVRKIFNDHNVFFQTAELGKVDVGGGGTIAYIAALYEMEVIDSGVSVLSMHAPWEVTSKADVYEAYKAYKAFLLDA